MKNACNCVQICLSTYHTFLLMLKMIEIQDAKKGFQARAPNGQWGGLGGGARLGPGKVR